MGIHQLIIKNVGSMSCLVAHRFQLYLHDSKLMINGENNFLSTCNLVHPGEGRVGEGRWDAHIKTTGGGGGRGCSSVFLEYHPKRYQIKISFDGRGSD